MKGSIRETSPGHWEIRYDVPDDTGRRVQKQKTIRGTKGDAEKERRRILSEIDRGTYADPGKLTVADYLKKWLEDWARPNLAGQTFGRYERIVESHLIPALGQGKLSALTPALISKYLAGALKSGRRVPTPGPLAAGTVRLHYLILHRALAVAVKWELLSRNPADAADPPRQPAPEQACLTKEQAWQLLQGSQGHKLAVPIILALGLGLRRGEVFGLKWEDVDFGRAAVQVRRSLEQTTSKLKEPKTARGRRVVTAPEFVLLALKAHKKEQDRAKELIGKGYHDQGLICCLPDGSPVDKHHTECFVTLLKHLGLPQEVTFHGLRHTHSTLLLQDGENPRVVSERLGHSDIRVTLQVYGHVMPGVPAQTAAHVEALFGRPK